MSAACGTPVAVSAPMAANAPLVATFCFLIASAAPLGADQYRIAIRRLDTNLYQAQSSKVIIETRRCVDWDAAGSDTEEAILNWEGLFGNNWILFTASRTKCDVVAIR